MCFNFCHEEIGESNSHFVPMAIPVNLETKAEYLFRLVGRDEWAVFVVFFSMFRILFSIVPRGGGGLLPYKGLMGTRGHSGYVLSFFVLIRVSI